MRTLTATECIGVLDRSAEVLNGTRDVTCDHIGVNIGLENQPQAVLYLGTTSASLRSSDLVRNDSREGTVWIQHTAYDPFIRGDENGPLLPNPAYSRIKASSAIRALSKFLGRDQEEKFPLGVFRLGSGFFYDPKWQIECAYMPEQEEALHRFLGDVSFSVNDFGMIDLQTQRTPELTSVAVELSFFPPED